MNPWLRSLPGLGNYRVAWRFSGGSRKCWLEKNEEECKGAAASPKAWPRTKPSICRYPAQAINQGMTSAFPSYCTLFPTSAQALAAPKTTTGHPSRSTATKIRPWERCTIWRGKRSRTSFFELSWIHKQMSRRGDTIEALAAMLQLSPHQTLAFESGWEQSRAVWEWKGYSRGFRLMRRGRRCTGIALAGRRFGDR